MPILSVGRTNRRTAAGGRAARGVTLIEMLVVVSIVGLVVSISLPSVAAGIDSVRIGAAAQSISSFLNAAATRAERGQQPVEVLILPKERRLVLYSNQPGSDRELKMPDGIAIEAILPRIDDSADPQEGRRLIFIPGASVPGIGVAIANNHGSRRVVRLDPMTGFPHIEAVQTNSGE